MFFQTCAAAFCSATGIKRHMMFHHPVEGANKETKCDQVQPFFITFNFYNFLNFLELQKSEIVKKLSGDNITGKYFS